MVCACAWWHTQDIQQHAEMLVAKLRDQFETQASELRAAATAKSKGLAATQYELSFVAQTPAGQGEASVYAGSKWTFKVVPGTAIPIGRSKGKKFTSGGISMPKDNGVSSSHAKVSSLQTRELRGDEFWFSSSQHCAQCRLLFGAFISFTQPPGRLSESSVVLKTKCSVYSSAMCFPPTPTIELSFVIAHNITFVIQFVAALLPWQVELREGRLMYTDLGSSNGTFLNGKEVTETELATGDKLILGDTELVVTLTATTP